MAPHENAPPPCLCSPGLATSLQDCQDFPRVGPVSPPPPALDRVCPSHQELRVTQGCYLFGDLTELRLGSPASPTASPHPWCQFPRAVPAWCPLTTPWSQGSPAGEVSVPGPQVRLLSWSSLLSGAKWSLRCLLTAPLPWGVGQNSPHVG